LAFKDSTDDCFADILENIGYIEKFLKGMRHAYDNLDSMMIWKVYQDDLPPLKAAVLRALNPPPPKGPAPG
jgi:uncharacterized protein with HEPN domain